MRDVTTLRLVLCFLTGGCVFLPSLGSSGGFTTGCGTTVPGASSCPMFPANNVWNTPITNLPVDPHSAEWLTSMSSSTTDLHPDFGPSGNPATPYGIPFVVVSPNRPPGPHQLRVFGRERSRPISVLQASTPIEGGRKRLGIDTRSW